MNYLIVDDESAAHKIIEDFAQKIPFLTKVGNCYHAMEAIEDIKRKKVDLIFLDINMPQVSGFQLLKSIKHPPRIIVTTAYQEYAIEGYELDLVDYLLKPFGFDRFLKAVMKVKVAAANHVHSVTTERAEDLTLFVKSGRKHHRLRIADILYIEAQGNYIKIQLEDRSLLTYMSLAEMEQNIPEHLFVRVHKSFIVALNHISTIEGNRIKIGNFEIPIGQNYRRYALDRIGLSK